MCNLDYEATAPLIKLESEKVNAAASSTTEVRESSTETFGAQNWNHNLYQFGDHCLM